MESSKETFMMDDEEDPQSANRICLMDNLHNFSATNLSAFGGGDCKTHIEESKMPNSLGKTVQLINRLFDTIAINDDSEISWNEFLMFQLQAKSILQDRWPIYNIGQVREAFAEMDSNGNGKITRQEFITEVANSFDKSISRPLELFLKQMEHARSTCSNAKKSFVNRMMVDFDKTDLDEDGTIQACDYAQKIVMRFNDNAPQFRILLMILENYDCRISRNEFQHLVHQCYIDFTR